MLNRPSRMRWVMISFAFTATVLNYIHRLSFNYLTSNGPLRELIPDDVFGYIATCFFIAYLLSNAVSGFIIDRLGTRIGYSLSMAFWTTAGILHALAMTPFQFGFFRFLLGIGEAGNWPAAIKLTSEWFPPNERSTASGIFNSGAAVGAVVAPPLIAWLGTAFGWQTTFVVVGLLGYVWLAFFLLRNRFVAGLTLSKVFMDPVWYFITFWIGRYLADVYGWNLSASFDYTFAYSAVFIGYGLMALVGLSIVLFMTGPLVQNKDLQDYADSGIKIT